MKKFLNSFKNGDNDALIESIIAGYNLIFESADNVSKSIGYKVMSVVDGRLVAGRDSRQSFDLQLGPIAMTGNGIYMSPHKDYVLDYYSGLGDDEVLLTLEYDPNDITTGDLTDNEPEISVPTANIIKIQKIEDGVLIEATGSWYPPRKKLSVESDRDKVMFSMLKAFKALSPNNQMRFMKNHVPKGTEIAIYSLEQLPTDVLIRMKENLMDIRDEEKDYEASLNREAKEAKAKKSYERNMDKADEEQKIENEYQKAQARKEQQQLLNQKIDSGEIDVDELKRLREDGVIDSHNQYIYHDELDKSLLGKAEKRLRRGAAKGSDISGGLADMVKGVRDIKKAFSKKS